MPRAHPRFTQADLARAFKAARDAGVVVRIEIEPEKITITQLGAGIDSSDDELRKFRYQHGYG
jgi:hypothetical protein